MIDSIAPDSRTRPATPEVHRLAREVLAHLARSGAPCAAATTGEPATELTNLARTCVDRMIRELRGEPVPERIARLESTAAGWARGGIPIDTVLHAAHRGFEAAVDLLFPRTDPGVEFDIATGIAVAMRLLNQFTSTVSKTYVRELRSVAAEHHTAVHTLTSALLGGHPTSAAARDSGIPVAASYLVLAVSMPAHPDEQRPGLDGQVVARRKLRRVQSALAATSRDRALSLLSTDGGTVLLPADRFAEADTDALVDDLSAAAQVPLTAAVLETETALIATATRHTHELLDTVEQLGLGPGLHRFADLAMEYQLTRPGIGRTVLQRRLLPLDEHPELLRTLREYFAAGRDRRVAARAMGVHPNTIDYRLRRVGELTGLDIADTRSWWYLNAALITRSAPSGEPDWDSDRLSPPRIINRHNISGIDAAPEPDALD
ncbi:PucR family transcriptional regulator [Nocardia takedensis]|uniref:PucR family transcriptional regulator n=1 Tax=Nocardia takedensis TaxID=259390 RepID=UPI0002F1D6E5|nr:helix-turn-helix domain-containing protein [Nocardia takedensis]